MFHAIFSGQLVMVLLLGLLDLTIAKPACKLSLGSLTGPNFGFAEHSNVRPGTIPCKRTSLLGLKLFISLFNTLLLFSLYHPVHTPIRLSIVNEYHIRCVNTPMFCLFTSLHLSIDFSYPEEPRVSFFSIALPFCIPSSLYFNYLTNNRGQQSPFLPVCFCSKVDLLRLQYGMIHGFFVDLLVVGE